MCGRALGSLEEGEQQRLAAQHHGAVSFLTDVSQSVHRPTTTAAFPVCFIIRPHQGTLGDLGDRNEPTTTIMCLRKASTGQPGSYTVFTRVCVFVTCTTSCFNA